MKILIVAGRLDWSVPTTHALGLVEGLIQRGHQIQMVCRGGVFLPRFRDLGVEVYEYPSSWLARRKLSLFLAEFAPDVIHATGGVGAQRITVRLAAILKVPTVHTVHSWLSRERSARATKHASAVIAVNQDLREHLVSELRISRRRSASSPTASRSPTGTMSRGNLGGFPSSEPSAGSTRGVVSMTSSTPPACSVARSMM